MTQQVIWKPNEGPQAALIACPVFEVFYGGARGGGKTEGSIGDWLEHSNRYGSAAIGVFFRRTFKQLEEVIARTKELFPHIGAKYNEQQAQWTMPGGGRLKFRYLERDRDAEEYQGHSYTRVYVEEVTNFPSPGPINKLRATLRSGAGVPCCLRLTGNPGGPGHQWVKKRFIDPEPRGYKIITESFPGREGRTLTRERIFIPSKVDDNPRLPDEYIANLHQSGNEALVRAWLNGDWNIVQGAFFDCFDPGTHVIQTRALLRAMPRGIKRFRALDWGSAKPFSVGWYAIADGTWGFPFGSIIRYREWYGSSGEPNVGLKMNADLVARGILARQNLFDEPVDYGVADPSIFIRSGGPSIMEMMAKEGCFWRKADNKRVPGWQEVQRRLQGHGPEGPLLYIADCCEDLIRTLPTLQHDETDPEDLDTEQEDHAADELRYACMSRPTPREQVNEGELLPKLPQQYTITELIAQRRQRRLASEA